MKSLLPLLAFLSLLLFSSTIASARKDVGNYWRAAMRDQPMPEVLEGLVRIEAASVVVGSNEKTEFNTPSSIELREEKNVDVEYFEPRPNISVYGNDASLNGSKSSSFADDFEPRPNISAYGGDDADLKGEKKSEFTSEFEQEPNISVYGN